MTDAKITLLFPRSVKNKLDDYINLAAGEISGLGEIEKVQEGVFRVTDVFLYKQRCSSASTTIENEAIHEFIVDRITQGGSVENIKLWWHSHYNFGCFWSGTDEGAIQNIENDYLISIVQNQAGKHKTRIDLFKPFRTTVHDLNVVIEENEGAFARKEVIPEEKPLMPLHTVVSTLSMTLGTQFRDLDMPSFKSAIRQHRDVFQQISSLFSSYSEMIGLEMKEIEKEGIEERRAPIKQEISDKVTFASGYYNRHVGYHADYWNDFDRAHSRKGKGGKHKGSKSDIGTFNDGWDEQFDLYNDVYPGGMIDREIDDDFRRAVILNDEDASRFLGAPASTATTNQTPMQKVRDIVFPKPKHKEGAVHTPTWREIYGGKKV